MFQPSRDEVRSFFCTAWRKQTDGALVTPQEAVALRWINLHPEYHGLLGDPRRALAEDFSVERGQTNPFLHLSMHLALDEQLSIDQPSGVRAVFERLQARCASMHDAAHQAMECLGQVVWEAQRGTLPADTAAINAAYLDCLLRHASQ